MAELNPFSLPIILAPILSMIAFYVAGGLALPRLSNAIMSIGVRMSIGCLVVISSCAVIYAGLGTGLIFYLVLLLYMVKQNWGGFDFSDLSDIGIKGISILVLFVFCITFMEAYRSDLIDGAAVFVGNADVSYYASFGHSLYVLGVESNAENLSPGLRGDVYHFGDLWLSGLYSYVAGITPYYAYTVVYRSITIVLISIMVFGWVRKVKGHWLLGLLSCFLAMGSVYIMPINVSLPEVSLLEFITCRYPIYGAHAYFIVAVVGLAFSILMFEGKFTVGAVGVMLLPFVSSGFLLATAGAALLVIPAYFILKWLDVKAKTPTGLETLLIVASGFVGIIYFKLDGRLDDPTMNLLSGEFIYLFVHTLIRLLLSQLFVIPFLIGFWYFLRNKPEHSMATGFQFLIFAGILGSLAFIFPQIQGNSTQITSIHFTSLIAPIAVIGLVALTKSSGTNPKWLSGLAWAALALITFEAVQIAMVTEGYSGTFKWTHLEGYQEESSLPVEDCKVLRHRFSKEENRIGYFAHPSEKAQGVHYNAFTYLKGILPGTTFNRMNPLPSDTTLSTEMLGYYYRTGLGHFARKNAFDQEATISEYLEYLQPDAIIVPSGNAYYFPSGLATMFPNKTSTESFTIYEK